MFDYKPQTTPRRNRFAALPATRPGAQEARP